ncbi:MAG: A/G-specific adenine glycosylase [Leeuwenhoekiella sp.]
MASFSNKLIDWYLQNKRDLPWRQTKDPYAIWLSEIILQQTRVEQGKPYYFNFLREYPTVFDLAAAKESQVLKTWQGLGYYSRARNLHATARKVVGDYNGKFPDNYKDLKTLKGVGDYTASAIASICFEEPAAVVDGNVYRVLSRYYGIETPIDTSAGQKEFKNLAQELIDKDRPASFNQAVMEFGATQCKPKNPYCLYCPFNDSCVALQKGKIGQMPVKKGKIKVRKRYFNYIVCLVDGKKTLVQKRTAKGIWQGLNEFPLLETDSDIDLKTFRRLLGNSKEWHLPKLRADSEISLFNKKPIIHKLSHQHLSVKFWILKNPDIHTLNALSISTLGEYAVPRVIDKFLDSYEWKP